MLTKSDKKFILDTVSGAINENNKVLINEMTELFTVTDERIDGIIERLDKTNNRIDDSNKRIDKVLIKLEDHHDTLNNHELRIEKVEEKIFTTTTV